MPAGDVPGAFNADLLATGVVAAWLDALTKLQERCAGPLGGVHTPCDALYAALPDPRSVAVQAPGDVAAAEAARKMTAFVATKVARQGPDSKALDCKSFHR